MGIGTELMCCRIQATIVLWICCRVCVAGTHGGATKQPKHSLDLSGEHVPRATSSRCRWSFSSLSVTPLIWNLCGIKTQSF